MVEWVESTHRDNAYRCPECARRKDAEMPSWHIGAYLGAIILVAMGLGGAIGRYWPSSPPEPSTDRDIAIAHVQAALARSLRGECYAGFGDAGQPLPVCAPTGTGYVQTVNGVTHLVSGGP